MISTLIVDDEALAREGIRLLLEDVPDVTIVGEATDGAQAVEEIKKLSPDLVFLDVHMPGLQGFEILQRIAPVHTPAVIFVTAHDRYAVDAFDAHAVDYLLKPFTDERFYKALSRARRLLEVDQHPASPARPVSTHSAHPPQQPRSLSALSRFPGVITVKTGRRITLVKIDEIDWIESASNYVEVHANKQTHLIRMTMGEIETKLDPSRFARIHRTTIVNVDRVQQLELGHHGESDLTLRDGTVLRASRQFCERLAQLLDL
jgi:two-component system LytT family response regulator